MPFIGNTPDVNFTSFAKQDLTGVTGSPAKRGFTLTHAVANANEIEVFVNNVRQEPTDAYTVSGTGLTMTGDVETTDDFYIIYLGKAIQTTVPPDGSVSTAKIADSAISSAKIASSAVDLTSKVTGVLPNANILGQATRPSFYAAELDGATWNTGTLTGAGTAVGYTNGGMSYNSSSGELTLPITGLYLLSASIFLTTGGGRGEASIQRKPSGGSFADVVMSNGNSTDTFDNITIAMTLTCSANDVLKVVRHSGSAYPYAHRATFFNVGYIGA